MLPHVVALGQQNQVLQVHAPLVEADVVENVAVRDSFALALPCKPMGHDIAAPDVHPHVAPFRHRPGGQLNAG